MTRAPRRSALRIPRRLVWSAVAVAGALGCGGPLSPKRDAAADLAAPGARDAAADLLATSDGCALIVRCMPAVAGAHCDGTFCGLDACPSGCEPYV
jgi:hypothetical protein